MFVEKLLAPKHSPFLEIEVHLFENCNIACGYCSQDHKDKGPNRDSFSSKAKLAKEYISFLKPTNEYLILNIMGGELIQDKFNIDIYKMYFDFIQEVISHENFPKRKVGITSNFLFKNSENLDYLLAELNRANIPFELKTSIDLKGRPYAKGDKEIFESNLTKYKSILSCISFCLHKLNIQEILKNKDQELERYYSEGYSLNFDWYIPDPARSHIFMPSDQECKEVLGVLFKKYPKADPLSRYLNNDLNPIQCCSENRILIPANEKVSNCVYLPHKEEDYRSGLNRGTTYDKAAKWVEDQDCLSCKHLNRCGFYCYAASDYNKRIKNAVCFIRENLNELFQSK